MNTCDDATIKRSILFGARIRFSPSGASVRNQAIERIIEQNLAAAETAKGLTEQGLQHLVSHGGQLSILRAADLRQGIDSLKNAGRVLDISAGKQPRYILSDTVRAEVDRVTAEAEESTKEAINELFGNASGGEDAYGRAFLLLLCKVFSELSDVYVQVITMKQEHPDLAEHKLLINAIEETLKSERVPDDQAFRYGVNRFFRESTPQFDQIKWNMAQNFYIAKALGIDDSSDLLSSDIFKNAALYCDTNVLIAGLTPENRHHNSFREMAKSCNAIGMCLKAARITLDELRGVINTQESLLREVIDRIPDETCPKIRNFLLEAYLSEKEKSPSLSLDNFFERFQTPLQTLRDSFGLIEVDNVWFDKAIEDSETKKLALDLSHKYKEMRGRQKSESAALHDAILILYVVQENTDGRKSWIVTLDITLAEWNTQKGMSGSKIITLDAFLQWMAPITSGAIEEGRLAGIFAEAIKYHLLPRDTFFQLRDFQVFAEMGIETKQLPADDVEACIREIKKVGPQLDPSKAEDREKIGHVIQRYFADPGTKYKRTIEELQIQSKNLSMELAKEKQTRIKAEQDAGDLETRREEMSKEIKNGQNALTDANLRIERLERMAQEQEKIAQRKRLVVSTVWLTALALTMLVVVEAIIGYQVWQYGEGANLFQKLTNAWQWLGLGFAFVVILYPFFMGRERMRLLKWWKGETD